MEPEAGVGMYASKKGKEERVGISLGFSPEIFPSSQHFRFQTF